MKHVTVLAVIVLLLASSGVSALPFGAASQESTQPSPDRFVTTYKGVAGNVLGTSTTVFDRYGGVTNTLRDASGQVIRPMNQGMSGQSVSKPASSVPPAYIPVPVAPSVATAPTSPSRPAGTPFPVVAPAGPGVVPRAGIGASGRSPAIGNQGNAGTVPGGFVAANPPQRDRGPLAPFGGLDGKDVTGSSHEVGGTTYYSFHDRAGNNLNGNSRPIGGTTYYSFQDRDGNNIQGNSRTIGGTTYYSSNDFHGNRVSGSSRTIGGTTYYSSSDAKGNATSGSSHTIGGTTYYSASDRKGNSASGSSRTIGNTTYYSSHGR